MDEERHPVVVETYEDKLGQASSTVWGGRKGLRALPIETKVESGTSQNKRGTSVKLSNSGKRHPIVVESCEDRLGEGREARGQLVDRCHLRVQGFGVWV